MLLEINQMIIYMKTSSEPPFFARDLSDAISNQNMSWYATKLLLAVDNIFKILKAITFNYTSLN